MFRSIQLAARRYFCDIYESIERNKAKLSKFETRNFSDSIRLELKAGTGGNGCYSFFTSKTVRKGAPDGGCGGKGGDIILQAHKSMFDLSHLRRRRIAGNDGHPGGPQGKQGKNGGKTVVRVPCGTLVYQIQVTQGNADIGIEQVQRKIFLKDLDIDKQTYLVVKGGNFGKGNKVYPGLSEEQKVGQQGQRKIIFLQLKTLADVGLVGFPNIGKSTFLAAVSRALPKIANYEFTTLKPSVGYVKFVDDYKFTIADIPGIIEGAHENKGLGFQFLRHIQRTKILIFMLDITSENPLADFNKLQNQLTEYGAQKFASKKKIVLFNKKDSHPQSQKLFESYRKKIPYSCFLASAKEGDNVGTVLVQLRKILQEIEAEELAQKEEEKFKV